MTHKFSIEHKGKTYQCERIVAGKRVFRQTIVVIGVGSKDDSADYGPHAHPTATMESIARLIAHEIIGNAN